METREELLYQRNLLEQQIRDVKVRLLRDLPEREFRVLEARRQQLGGEIQSVNLKLATQRTTRRETLAELFMETTIRMLDPLDVSEIWDRIYAENPHLKRQ